MSAAYVLDAVRSPFGRYGAPQDGPMFYHRWIRAWLAEASGSFLHRI